MMENTVLNKISVKETRDLNAIEQISPANTPLNLDSNNIDFSIQSVAEKIQDLEGIKAKITEDALENIAKKIYEPAN